MDIENLNILSMDNQEKVREWYMTYLCYTQDWKTLIELIDNENFDQQRLTGFISDSIQKDFILAYNKDYISDLIIHLPQPGTAASQKLADLLWQTDEEYTNDYRELLGYYKKQEDRISRYIYKTLGLSSDNTAK